MRPLPTNICSSTCVNIFGRCFHAPTLPFSHTVTLDRTGLIAKWPAILVRILCTHSHTWLHRPARQMTHTPASPPSHTCVHTCVNRPVRRMGRQDAWPELCVRVAAEHARALLAGARKLWGSVGKVWGDSQVVTWCRSLGSATCMDSSSSSSTIRCMDSSGTALGVRAAPTHLYTSTRLRTCVASSKWQRTPLYDAYNNTAHRYSTTLMCSPPSTLIHLYLTLSTPFPTGGADHSAALQRQPAALVRRLRIHCTQPHLPD